MRRSCDRNRALLVAVLVLAASGLGAQQAPPPGAADAEATESVAPEGLPTIGKWMIAPDGSIAHWLGEIYEGKHLREPINVILVDEGASGAQDASARLIAAATAAGYPIRMGHSTGYRGAIGGILHPQLPQGRDDAFSDEIFELSNNHGRIFGPHASGGGYVFIGAFSRESVDPLRSPGHRFASFDRARDDFADRLERHTAFARAGFVPLGNAMIDDPQVTTGDHDGIAVLLRRR